MLTNYTIEGFENIQYQGFRSLAAIEARLKKLYQSYGYHQISIPTFESFDQFITDNTIPGDELFKFISRKGKVLALKPDATLSVARMAAINHHDPGEIIKFFYQTNIYRHFAAPSDVKKEITQMGVEFFGDTAPECDGEIIALAIESLRANGITDIQIDMGHVGYINYLLDELALSESDRTALISLIDNKNIGDIRAFLDARECDPAIAEIVLQLPQLYGKPRETFERMRTLCMNDKMRAVVADLQAIYRHLEAVGLADAVTFDLGFTNAMHYYSDLVFKAYVGGWGAPIIDGGRYDTLSRKFGIDRPACGFAVDLLGLMDYMDQHGLLDDAPEPHRVIVYTERAKPRAFALAADLRRQGLPVEIFCTAELLEHAIVALRSQQLYRDSYFYAITADGLFQFKNNQLMPIKAIDAAKTWQGE